VAERKNQVNRVSFNLKPKPLRISQADSNIFEKCLRLVSMIIDYRTRCIAVFMNVIWFLYTQHSTPS